MRPDMGLTPAICSFVIFVITRVAELRAEDPMAASRTLKFSPKLLLGGRANYRYDGGGGNGIEDDENDVADHPRRKR